MAKLSSLKIKMGQMHYEKQRKELDLQAMKVCFCQPVLLPTVLLSACCGCPPDSIFYF